MVTQTISGLACGRPIRGYVAFLGGPLQYLPELRKRFYETLNLDEEHIIVPENAHLFVASGCAIAGECRTSRTPRRRARPPEEDLGDIQGSEVVRLDPLFADEEDYGEFKRPPRPEVVPKGDLTSYHGRAFWASTPAPPRSRPRSSARTASFCGPLRQQQGRRAGLRQAAIGRHLPALPARRAALVRIVPLTGYGEALLLEALRVDSGEIETVAHLRGAQEMLPGVEFILDIGGQDMKCLRVKDGVIDHIMLNEACSSGCGSFIETFASGLNLDVAEFAETAIAAKSPVDLGSRCTVFMNSRVKQAQKEGATVGDIAAGLSYLRHQERPVQGHQAPRLRTSGHKVIVPGRHLHERRRAARLRAAHRRDAVRPDIAGNMGAYGAALLARDRCRQDRQPPACSSRDEDRRPRRSAHTNVARAAAAQTTAC